MGNETTEAEPGERPILVKAIRQKVQLMSFHVADQKTPVRNN